MSFKLESKDGDKSLNCYINGILLYKFIRNKITGHWDAFKFDENPRINIPIDSDKYRYDLAERLDLKIFKSK